MEVRSLLYSLQHLDSEVFFKILIILFLDTLNQQRIFLIIKINNFWGDLSGISAKTATLHLDTCRLAFPVQGQERVLNPSESISKSFYFPRHMYTRCSRFDKSPVNNGPGGTSGSNEHLWDQGACILYRCVSGSVVVLAEISLRSPRKLFIFIIKKYIYWIKVSKK